MCQIICAPSGTAGVVKYLMLVHFLLRQAWPQTKRTRGQYFRVGSHAEPLAWFSSPHGNARNKGGMTTRNVDLETKHLGTPAETDYGKPGSGLVSSHHCCHMNAYWSLTEEEPISLPPSYIPVYASGTDSPHSCSCLPTSRSTRARWR